MTFVETDVHSSFTGVRAILSRLSGMTGVESEGT